MLTKVKPMKPNDGSEDDENANGNNEEEGNEIWISPLFFTGDVGKRLGGNQHGRFTERADEMSLNKGSVEDWIKERIDDKFSSCL
nr:hypothetical transcript [Hymenolepis microstoma]